MADISIKIQAAPRETQRYPFGFSLGWQPAQKTHLIVNRRFKIFLKQQHRLTPLRSAN